MLFIQLLAQFWLAVKMQNDDIISNVSSSKQISPFFLLTLRNLVSKYQYLFFPGVCLLKNELRFLLATFFFQLRHLFRPLCIEKNLFFPSHHAYFKPFVLQALTELYYFSFCSWQIRNKCSQEKRFLSRIEPLNSHSRGNKAYQ